MATEEVVIENAQILFRNFKGKEGQYNKPGQRNFIVLLDEDMVRHLETLADDWNIKVLTPREDADPGEQPQPFLPIELRYDVGTPPRVVLITSQGRRNLEEHEVSDIDDVNIINVDLAFRGSHWDVNGRSGTKAYLRSIYVTIEEDYLELKYAHLERRQ